MARSNRNESEVRSNILLGAANIYITTMWQNWTNAVLGLAVIAVAFMGLSGAYAGWTLAILGAVIAVIGVWGAASLPESEKRESKMRHA